MDSKINLYDLRQNELADLLYGWGYGHHFSRQVWNLIYRQLVDSVSEMRALRPDLFDHLAMRTEMAIVSPIFSQNSKDGQTRKFLLRLSDGQVIETVLMHYPGRATACLSTQVGCAMGCVFCATGQMGFVRHLTAGEIVAQVIHTIKFLSTKGEQLRNVVFMGMGEPLHNLEATMAAIDIMTDDSGLGIGPRRITLSTVGLPPLIREFADSNSRVNLAVSLHAATDQERSELVPLSSRWPLAELIDACRYYVNKKGRRIFFEWALISGKNDTEGQAAALGRLLAGLEAHVNLIPLNHTAGYDGRPSDSETVRRFQAILAEHGLPSTVRQRRGLDIDAGCGQLRARYSSDYAKRAF